MSANEKVILEDLSHLLRSRFADDLKDIVLFGSRAYGKPRNDSDYDILVVLKQQADWKTEREISDICYEIDLKYDIRTDTHVICESELSTSIRGRQPIYANAIANGIHAGSGIRTEML